MLKPLSDPRVFAEVSVDDQMGTIAWPNGIDFAPRAVVRRGMREPSGGVRLRHPLL